MAAKKKRGIWNARSQTEFGSTLPTERWPSDHPYAGIFTALCKYPMANEDFELRPYTNWLDGHLTNLKISIEECEKLAEEWVNDRLTNKMKPRIVKASFRVTLYNYAHRRLHG